MGLDRGAQRREFEPAVALVLTSLRDATVAQPAASHGQGLRLVLQRGLSPLVLLESEGEFHAVSFEQGFVPENCFSRTVGSDAAFGKQNDS